MANMDGDNISYNIDSEVGPRKRRRIAIACTPCRNKKSRCDGNRPVCSMCRDAQSVCVYEQPVSATKVVVERDAISRLEERMKQMEDRMHAAEAEISWRAQNRDIPRATSITPLDHLDVNAYNAAEDNVDGMCVMDMAEDQNSGFFGPSSTISFLGYISRALQKACNHTISSNDQAVSGHRIAIINKSRPISSPADPTADIQFSAESIDIFALPSEVEALDLIAQYFSNSGLIFPYIHEGSFRNAYAQARYRDPTKVRRSFLTLLNVVFAAATCTTHQSGLKAIQTDAASNVFYQRALGLNNRYGWQSVGLETVQYLLLMVQYLQSTQRSVQTWSLHGQAVKTAFQIGLQSEEALSKYSGTEREMRKRTWYACVVMDRTLSMIFGRPASIPESYIKMELPNEIIEGHDSWVSLCTTAENEQSRICFFNATITLYQVLWTIIDLLYGQNIGAANTDPASVVLSHIAKLEWKLTEWVTTLPAHLKPNHASHSRSPETTNDWFRTILTLRYLNLRNLLHRPVLMKLLEYCTDRGLDPKEFEICKELGINSVQIAIESSMAIISIVYQAEDRHDSLGAWWFSMYYTFNAALAISTVLFISSQTSALPINRTRTTTDMNASLTLATEAMRQLRPGNDLIERCWRLLQKLEKVHIPSETSSSTVELASLPSLPQVELNRSQNNGTNLSGEGGGRRFEDLFEMEEFMGETDFSFLDDFPEMEVFGA